MAAVAISILKTKKLEDNREIVNAKLVFGDASTTYPAGGIPVPGKLFGCARFVDSFLFSDMSNPDANLYKYDEVNQKVRIYVSGAEMTGVIPASTAYVTVMGSK